jgi:hypothetical protein
MNLSFSARRRAMLRENILIRANAIKAYDKYISGAKPIKTFIKLRASDITIIATLR